MAIPKSGKRAARRRRKAKRIRRKVGSLAPARCARCGGPILCEACGSVETAYRGRSPQDAGIVLVGCVECNAHGAYFADPGFLCPKCADGAAAAHGRWSEGGEGVPVGALVRMFLDDGAEASGGVCPICGEVDLIPRVHRAAVLRGDRMCVCSNDHRFRVTAGG